MVFLLIAGFFGLLLGSFLNVIIYRLPRKESIVFPGSRCPACGVPIKYRDNIPIVSFLLLRGQCRACSARISWRYPLIEFVTGCMVMILFAINGLSLNFIADTVLGVILLAAAMIDIEYMIIPNRLTYSGMIIGSFLSLRWGWDGILRGFMGIFAGILILSVMFLLGKLLFRRESVGMGDFKLVFVIGLFFGPFWCFIGLILAILIGGMWGLFQLVTGRKQMGQEVPFAPFIAAGGFCVLFFKVQIIFLVEQYFHLI